MAKQTIEMVVANKRAQANVTPAKPGRPSNHDKIVELEAKLAEMGSNLERALMALAERNTPAVAHSTGRIKRHPLSETNSAMPGSFGIKPVGVRESRGIDNINFSAVSIADGGNTLVKPDPIFRLALKTWTNQGGRYGAKLADSKTAWYLPEKDYARLCADINSGEFFKDAVARCGAIVEEFGMPSDEYGKAVVAYYTE